jgi:hypothetical protein
MRVDGAVLVVVLWLALGGTVFATSEPSEDIPVGSSAENTPVPPTELPSPTTPPEPPSLVTVEGGRLTVLVENRPLEWILDEISRKSGVAVTGAETETGQPVSVQFKDLPLDQGLREILKDQDAFFFYGVDEKGGDETRGSGEAQSGSSLKAVWVYPKGQGRQIAPVPPEQWASTREMKQGVTDPDPGVRSRTLELLVEREGERALNEVVLALRDRDDQVRERALHAALNSGMPLLPALLEELVQHDPSPMVRFLALGAVAGSNADSFSSNPNIKKVAEFALNDPSPEVKEQARQILEQLEHSPGPTEPEEQQGVDQGQATEFNDSAPPTDLEGEGQQGEHEAP